MLNSTQFINITNGKFYENYDYTGALVYLTCIIGFYSLSVVAIIYMQTKKSSDFFDEDEYIKKAATPESILRQMKKENINRLVLEDLRKPEVRDKLWSMYNDHIKDNSNKQLQEKKRLGLIDKKLKFYHKTEGYSPYATIQHTSPQPRPVVMRQMSDRIKFTAEKSRHSTQEPHTNRNKGRFLIDIPNEIK